MCIWCIMCIYIYMYQKPLSSQVLVSPCNPSPDELEQTLIPKSHQNHQTLESEKENRNKIDPNYYSWGSKILFLGLLSHLNCLNSNDLDPSRCSCPSALAAASTNLPDDLPKWCPFQTSEARLYKHSANVCTISPTLTSFQLLTWVHWYSMKCPNHFQGKQSGFTVPPIWDFHPWVQSH